MNINRIKMENMEVNKFRQQASVLSKGSSSEPILTTLLGEIQKLPSIASALDLGCGQGVLLGNLKRIFPEIKLTGCDYSDFDQSENSFYEFLQHDCNQGLPFPADKFDLVLSSEVIEHLENPRHYLREMAKVTKPGGYILLSTPNIECFTSLISFCLRGFHSAFGGKAYPAHITAVSVYDIKNIISETEQLKLVNIGYVADGRMPGTKFKWQNIIPWLGGKRFSDNYYVLAQKQMDS